AARPLAILLVEPSDEPATAETGGVGRKNRLDGPQGQAALDDQGVQHRRQLLALQVGADAYAVHQTREVAALVRVGQVAGKAAAGNGRVDLQRCGEDHVGEPGWPAPDLGRGRLIDALAQIEQEGEEALLLRLLSLVVSMPV